MNTADRVWVCNCQAHAFTADTSGIHTLMVPVRKRRLLQNTGWHVAPINKGSKRLQARANSSAPGIRRKQLLHRLVTKAAPHRRVRAIDGNLLNGTYDNLQTCSRSDVAILNRRGEPTKLVGVTYQVPPRWLKTEKRWSASIKVDGVAVHLGSWKSANEAGCAFDRAARMLYGKNAVTNQCLGLITRQVAMTKVCRIASRQARNRVREHKERCSRKGCRRTSVRSPRLQVRTHSPGALLNSPWRCSASTPAVWCALSQRPKGLPRSSVRNENGVQLAGHESSRGRW